MPGMSTPSPGPGWWQASDGNWYPQKWEYTTDMAWSQPHIKAAAEAMEPAVTTRGQKGWEMVNFTVSCQQAAGIGKGATANPNNLVLASQQWFLLIYWKRPLAP
jgi:hypothetical protein